MRVLTLVPQHEEQVEQRQKRQNHEAELFYYATISRVRKLRISRSRNIRGTRAPAQLSATEAARNFSELLNRVHCTRQTYLIERGGQTVCEIRPAYAAVGFNGFDLARLFASLPEAPSSYLDAVEQAIEEQPPAEETRWPR